MVNDPTMRYNAVGDEDVSTRVKVEDCSDVCVLRELVSDLWALLDEIDTADDLAKFDNDWYRRRVRYIIDGRKRTGVACDGYNIYVP